MAGQEAVRHVQLARWRYLGAEAARSVSVVCARRLCHSQQDNRNTLGNRMETLPLLRAPAHSIPDSVTMRLLASPAAAVQRGPPTWPKDAKTTEKM